MPTGSTWMGRALMAGYPPSSAAAAPSYTQKLFDAREQRLVRSEAELRQALDDIAQQVPVELRGDASSLLVRSASRVTIIAPIAMENGLEIGPELGGVEIETLGYCPLSFKADAPYGIFINGASLVTLRNVYIGTSALDIPVAGLRINAASALRVTDSQLLGSSYSVYTDAMAGDAVSEEVSITGLYTGGAEFSAALTGAVLHGIQGQCNLTLQANCYENNISGAFGDVELLAGAELNTFTGSKIGDFDDSGSDGSNIVAGCTVQGTVTLHPGSEVTSNSGSGFDGDFLSEPTEPAAPSSGYVRVYGSELTGRGELRIKGSSGFDAALQPAFFDTSIVVYAPGNGTVPTVHGGRALTAVGTVSHPNLANTNLLTASRRWQVVSAATANAAAAHRVAYAGWQRGTSGRGGFFFCCRWAPVTAVSGDRALVGFTATTAALSTSLVPSSLLNCVFVGNDAGDTNLQLMHNDGSGTCTKVDLGATFPAASPNQIIDISFYCAPSSSSISYAVTDVATGTTVTGTISTDLPTSTTFLAPHIYMNNGGVARTVSWACMKLYIEAPI